MRHMLHCEVLQCEAHVAYIVKYCSVRHMLHCIVSAHAALCTCCIVRNHIVSAHAALHCEAHAALHCECTCCIVYMLHCEESHCECTCCIAL